MIDIAIANAQIKANHCKRLGVDDFSIEPYYDNQLFGRMYEQRVLVRWRKGMERFHEVFAVPTKKIEYGFWPFKSVAVVEDFEQLENEVTAVIKKSLTDRERDWKEAKEELPDCEPFRSIEVKYEDAAGNEHVTTMASSVAGMVDLTHWRELRE